MTTKTTTTTTRLETIENASLDDVLPGDHITWEVTETIRGLTSTARREGIAHHRDAFNNWRTKDGDCITLAEGESEGVTITIRRTVQDLPRYDEAVIVPIDEDGVVDAGFSGMMYTTRHATYDSRTDTWVGLWRRTAGDTFIARMAPRNIIKYTWKEKDD